jgi:hypothetical protein
VDVSAPEVLECSWETGPEYFVTTGGLCAPIPITTGSAIKDNIHLLATMTTVTVNHNLRWWREA